MSEEWVLPHDPELLYLREKVQRLEAELEVYRQQQPENFFLLRRPETIAVRSILPLSYRITTLEPLVEVRSENDPGEGRYHVILRGGFGDDSIGYGYYVTHRELYSMVDICGLMAHLHERTVHSLAKFIEKKRDDRQKL